MKEQSRSYPHFLDLHPVMKVQGTVRLPGSKSISNRILLLAALSKGTTQIHDLLASDDTMVMLNALHSLGVHWTQEGETQNYKVVGAAGHFPHHQSRFIYGKCRNSDPPISCCLSCIGW